VKKYLFSSSLVNSLVFWFSIIVDLDLSI